MRNSKDMDHEKSGSDTSCYWSPWNDNKYHDKWIEKTGILIKAEYIQTTALLGAERILTKVLES